MELYHTSLLDQLKAAIANKIPNVERKNILSHHIDALARTSMVAMDKIFRIAVRIDWRIS